MKKNVIRLLMMFVAILTANTMLAENKLTITDNVSVCPELLNQAAGTFAIMMDNDATAAGLQFDLVLPKGVSIVPTKVDGSLQDIYRNPDRFNQGQIYKTAQTGDNVYTVLVVSQSMKPFVGTSGPVAFFRLRSQAPGYETLTLSNIVMFNNVGDGLECDSSFSGNFQVGDKFVEFYSESSVIAVVPGQKTFKFPVGLRNSQLLAGFQLDMQLPEGFKFAKTDPVVSTSRMSNSAWINVFEHSNNTYRLIASDMMTNQAVRNTGEGVIFDVTITVPETIPDNAQIVIKDALASTLNNVTIQGIGCEVSVVDGNKAYDAAKASIKELQDALDAALAQIATDCPDVKDQFTGADIQTAIDNLTAAVDAAFQNGTLTS
ncbi:MAG: hypothetical protein NC311_12665, partial [Muribaculaceae bacterium]|nr:hypothetical protein [Muribaculaceae bacterium]